MFDGYLRRHLPPQRSIKFVDFATAQVIEGHLRAIDLLEDGSILLVPTPGHTVDHFSVLVSTNRGPVFLLGDAAFTLRNLDEQVPPWRNHDDEAYSKSLRQLRAYQETHPDTLLAPTHDARAWKQLETRS